MVRKKENYDLALLLLRIVTGGLMLPHGLFKILNGHGKIEAMLMAKGLPGWLWIGVPFTEVLAPICLICGIFSRLSGLMLVAVMLFSLYLTTGWAAFTFGKSGGLSGELNFLFLVNGLVLFMTGPGKYVLLSSSRKILQ